MTLPEAFVVAAGRVTTCDPSRATPSDPLGVIEDGAVFVERGRIVHVGPRAEVLARAGDAPLVIDEPHRLLTPGLCDAHTHSAWVGSRHDEYALRMAGGDYEAIAKQGGGIKASRRALRQATREEIASELVKRLRRMASLGVTTVEVKSGYGLDLENERKQLEAIALAASRTDLPRIVPTYLGLHAVPEESAGDVEGYVAAAARAVADFASENLMRFVDAYVDRSAFTVEQARLLGRAALDVGIGVRLHVGQFADIGGAQLAAELSAKSVDHLENVGEAGLEALAAANTRAVLLPVASLTLRQAPPPVANLRRHGIRMVVASDANPGTAPTESLPLALALAVCSYGLSPEEALLGATREAASSLDLEGKTGALAASHDADLVVWDLPHERALVQPWGVSKARHVIARGRRLL